MDGIWSYDRIRGEGVKITSPVSVDMISKGGSPDLKLTDCATVMLSPHAPSVFIFIFSSHVDARSGLLDAVRGTSAYYLPSAVATI